MHSASMATPFGGSSVSAFGVLSIAHHLHRALLRVLWIHSRKRRHQRLHLCLISLWPVQYSIGISTIDFTPFFI